MFLKVEAFNCNLFVSGEQSLNAYLKPLKHDVCLHHKCTCYCIVTIIIIIESNQSIKSIDCYQLIVTNSGR